MTFWLVGATAAKVAADRAKISPKSNNLRRFTGCFFHWFPVGCDHETPGWLRPWNTRSMRHQRMWKQKLSRTARCHLRTDIYGGTLIIAAKRSNFAILNEVVQLAIVCAAIIAKTHSTEASTCHKFEAVLASPAPVYVTNLKPRNHFASSQRMAVYSSSPIMKNHYSLQENVVKDSIYLKDSDIAQPFARTLVVDDESSISWFTFPVSRKTFSLRV